MTPYVTTEEISEALGLHISVVRRMVRDGAIPGVLRVERPMRVSRAAFDEWLRKGG